MSVSFTRSFQKLTTAYLQAMPSYREAGKVWSSSWAYDFPESHYEKGRMITEWTTSIAVTISFCTQLFYFEKLQT